MIGNQVNIGERTGKDGAIRIAYNGFKDLRVYIVRKSVDNKKWRVYNNYKFKTYNAYIKGR